MKFIRSTCCGCSVKTGALVISYITLIQAIVPILNILSNTVPDMSSDKKISNEYKRDLMWLSVATIVVVAHALYGIYKKKAKYMIPFMLYKMVLIFIFAMILGFAPAMVEEIKKHFEHIREDNVLPCIILTSLFFLAVEAYFLLILFSHYQNVRHEIMEAETSRSTTFSSVVPEPIASPVPSYASEASKKMAPPPYAV